MLCSYCGTDMRITTSKVKRPVPTGAKDLNLYDDVTCWQCPKCGKTSDEGLINCEKCNVKTVKCLSLKQAATIPDAIPISLLVGQLRDEEGILKSYWCVNCQPCVICKQPLKDHDLIEVETDRPIGQRGYYSHEYRYSHKRCATQENLKRFVKNKEANPSAPGILKKLFGDLF